MKADPDFYAGMVAWLANKGERDCPFRGEIEPGVDWRMTGEARRQRWLAGYWGMSNAAQRGHWGWLGVFAREANISTQADYTVERVS